MYSYHCVNVFYSIYHFSQTIKTASFILQIPRLLSVTFIYWIAVSVKLSNDICSAPLKTCCIWHWAIIQGKSLFTWSFVCFIMVIGHMTLADVNGSDCHLSVPQFTEVHFTIVWPLIGWASLLIPSDWLRQNIMAFLGNWQYLDIWSNHSLSHGPIWALRYFEIVWIVIIRTREICEYQEWGRGTHLDNHFVSCDPRLVMQPNNLIGTRHSIMFWILLCSGKQRFN